MDRKHLSRRVFLGGALGGVAAALLAACGGAAGTTVSSGGSGAAPTQSNPFSSVAPTATKPAASAAPSTGAAPSASTGASSAPTGAPTSAASAAASPAASGGFTSTGKMTYWGGLIFSDEANNLLSSTVKDWGKQNKIDIDVVMINQNETNTKVAAVESNTLPDALDMGLDLMLLLSNTQKLTALDDLYNKIGSAQGAG